MKLYNTLTRQIETIEPITPPKVGLYACGFTVYDYTHLGHLRKYTMDDILVRMLRHQGYEVKFVQNVTDVGHLASDADTGDDKLEKGAKKYGQTVWDIAHKFEDYFFYSMDLMGNLRPDISCRATEHIEEQLELVKELEAKGFTYVIEEDGVYFDTSKLTDYGKLARLNIEALKEGARVEMVAGKRNPTDFALWKFERPGENRAMVWPSPWSERSFPGWHIECSAMSMKYLGDQFDIHTGGIDHIAVHHTNEIAQTEAATGKEPFVKYWVHHNHLKVEGVKMSKSLGNFYTIDDVLNKGINPKALRFLFLTSHYRSEMNFTWNNLQGIYNSWQRLIKQVSELRAEVKAHQLGQAEIAMDDMDNDQPLSRKFWDYMSDDLKTPEAVSVLWEVVKDDVLSARDKYQMLMQFNQVLQLGLEAELDPVQMAEPLAQLPAAVEKLLVERRLARENKDWQLADQLRDELANLGYEIVDGPNGAEVYQKSS